jgi:hypothetical protein
MLIQVTKTTMVGGQLVRAGSTIEASNADAQLLIGIGKAITATIAVDPEPDPQPPKRRTRNVIPTDT